MQSFDGFLLSISYIYQQVIWVLKFSSKSACYMKMWSSTSPGSAAETYWFPGIYLHTLLNPNLRQMAVTNGVITKLHSYIFSRTSVIASCLYIAIEHGKHFFITCCQIKTSMLPGVTVERVSTCSVE